MIRRRVRGDRYQPRGICIVLHAYTVPVVLLWTCKRRGRTECLLAALDGF